jgi:orotidine-5'-phosphate decarboxylase
MRRASDEFALRAAAYEIFCYGVIDVVAPLVPAVKPQAAFFEECGPAGTRILARVIRRAREAGLIVICDAKRGDIGSTAQAYANAYLAGEDPQAAVWGADALTVSPYLGSDTLEPFVETAVERGAGIYVLVRTSNPGSGTFQGQATVNAPTHNHGQESAPAADDSANDARPLYLRVAETVAELSEETDDGNGYGAVGAVVGATYPRELAQLREIMPRAPLLVPGYGSQGGGANDVAAAFQADGRGALVNNSRGILFAHAREPYAEQFGDDQWQQAVQAATKDMIADLAEHTPAGVLQTPNR